MSTYINTNTTAYMASMNLDNNTNSLQNDIEQLSTGLRINSAADDPAGYVMSENMSAQISGLTQATANSNDASNMIKTAESALTQVQNLIVSMRQLAVQASNTGVYDSTDLQADQTQINSAISSINNIAATTQFGSKYLLDGSNTTAGVYTGGSSSLGGTPTGVTIMTQGRWGSQAGATPAITAGAMKITSGATSTQYQMSGTGFATGDDFTSGTVNFGGSITINGNTYNIANNSTLASFNAAIASSGFQAQADATTKTDLDFVSTTPGSTVQVPTVDTSQLSVDDSAAGGGAVALTYSAAGSKVGTNPVMSIGTGASQINSSGSYYDSANNAFDYVFSNGLQVEVSNTLKVGGNEANTTSGTTLASTLTSINGTQNVTGNGPLEFQIGANEGQTSSFSIASVAASQLGWNTGTYTDSNGNTQVVGTDDVQDINVTSFKGAQDAVAVLDNALNQVTTLGAQLGAFQTNVLQSNIQSLGVANQNLQASQGTVEDADLASTVVDYTKNNILVQSATSALTYANQAPQLLLKLLQ